MNKQKQKQSKGKKSAKQVNKLAKDINKMKLPKSTPFADVGGTLGKSVGKMLGCDLSSAGRWLGSGIGSIFGSGDYEVVGPTPKYNVLSGSIPKFSTTHSTNVVTHREYLGDITGSAAFNILQYALNPGVQTTFPWLYRIAANYQQYKFHGLAFEFNSLVTDYVTSGAPGVIVLSTNYNADAPQYSSRQEMENAEFAVSRKPTINMMHMLECDISETMVPIKNVRNGPVPAGQDLRLYDLGLTQFATQNNPVQDLGELWVTYVVEFLKPVIQTSDPTYALHMGFGNVSGAAPFGTTSFIYPGSQLTAGLSGGSEQILTVGNCLNGQTYLFELNYINASTFASSLPAFSISGATAIATLGGGSSGTPTTSILAIPSAGGTSSTTSLFYSFVANQSTVTITLGTAGTISSGTPSTADLFIVPVPATVAN